MLVRKTLIDKLAMPLEIPQRPQWHLGDRPVKEATLYGPAVAVQENPPYIGPALSVFRKILVRDKSPGG